PNAPVTGLLRRCPCQRLGCRHRDRWRKRRHCRSGHSRGGSSEQRLLVAEEVTVLEALQRVPELLLLLALGTLLGLGACATLLGLGAPRRGPRRRELLARRLPPPLPRRRRLSSGR